MSDHVRVLSVIISSFNPGSCIKVNLNGQLTPSELTVEEFITCGKTNDSTFKVTGRLNSEFLDDVPAVLSCDKFGHIDLMIN